MLVIYCVDVAQSGKLEEKSIYANSILYRGRYTRLWRDVWTFVEEKVRGERMITKKRKRIVWTTNYRCGGTVYHCNIIYILLERHSSRLFYPIYVYRIRGNVVEKVRRKRYWTWATRMPHNNRVASFRIRCVCVYRPSNEYVFSGNVPKI